MAALPGVGVEHDDALGRLGVVGEAERVGRARVPHAVRHLGVEVVVAQEHQVGTQPAGVDLDLVDVGVAGLDLGDARVGEQEVAAVQAAAPVGLVQRVERGLHGQHLGDGVHHQPRYLDALVGEPVGEVDVGEHVGQRRVGAALPREPGSVVVAAYHHRGHAVVADAGQTPEGDAEGPVRGPGVVEHVAQPDHQLGLLIQRQLHSCLERELEVALALVHPFLGGVGQVGASQVGVPQRRDLHRRTLICQSTRAATLGAATGRACGGGGVDRTASS